MHTMCNQAQTQLFVCNVTIVYVYLGTRVTYKLNEYLYKNQKLLDDCAWMPCFQN